MHTAVRFAERPSPARLRGAARLTPAGRCTAHARGTQQTGWHGRLDRGCVVRLVATVAAGAEPPRRRGRASVTVGSDAEQAEPLARRAGNVGEPVAGEAGQAEPLVRKRKAPRVGNYGEKTADGKPKPDERTVADLVRRGWFKSEEDAVAVLTRAKKNHSRYAFQTAEPAADWLEATLGPEPVKDGLCPAARVVKLFPNMLYQDAAALQRKWDALTLPAERGGVGIALSIEQACEAVRKFPQLFSYSVETYKTGWTMLTVIENGLGLSPEEARKCILRRPEVLRFDHDKVVLRVMLLESLGYAVARTMVLAQPRVLGYKEETVKEHAAWWKQTGLDHVKLITTQPMLLGGVSVEDLQAKLDFLSRVAGMSKDDLNDASSLFGLSLDDRLRTRYFYALLKHRLGGRYGINSLMQVTDATYLAMMQGGSMRDRASKAEVARYQKLVASAGFVAWRERQEARLLCGP